MTQPKVVALGGGHGLAVVMMSGVEAGLKSCNIASLLKVHSMAIQ